MFGAYWWKRLGEKKVYNSTVQVCGSTGAFLLMVALSTFVILFASIGDVEHYQSATADMKFGYQVIFIIAVIAGMFSIIFLTGAGVALARALIATLRFWKIFGFSPPTTPEGVKALQSAVDNYIKGKAKWLNEVYKKEQGLQEDMRLFRNCGESCDTSEELERLVKTVSSRETEIKRYRGMIPGAKKGFYRAYNTARSRWLPVPFGVRGCKASFKDYLDGTIGMIEMHEGK